MNDTVTEYLTLDDLLEMIRALAVGPVRDVGLLDSAVNRPRSSAFGADAYESIELKAAALLHSLTKNHSLVDGNRRVAWLATVVFCDISGCDVTLTETDAFNLVWAIASSDVDLEQIAQRLCLERK